MRERAGTDEGEGMRAIGGEREAEIGRGVKVPRLRNKDEGDRGRRGRGMRVGDDRVWIRGAWCAARDQPRRPENGGLGRNFPYIFWGPRGPFSDLILWPEYSDSHTRLFWSAD